MSLRPHIKIMLPISTVINSVFIQYHSALERVPARISVSFLTASTSPFRGNDATITII